MGVAVVPTVWAQCACILRLGTKMSCEMDTDGSCCGLQKRYAQGIQEMVQQWIEHKPFNEDNYIVREGKLAEQYS
jgi:hypothetical protein